MKKYLTNIEAHNEVMNEQYVNNNFKTIEEIELIVKQHMINNFK